MNTRLVIIISFSVLAVLIVFIGIGYAVYKGIKLQSFWEGVKWFWMVGGILLILKLIEFGILFLVPID